ncbi:hypothetical protein ACRAWD_17520 [Caulobacter segnis]
MHVAGGVVARSRSRRRSSWRRRRSSKKGLDTHGEGVARDWGDFQSGLARQDFDPSPPGGGGQL